MMDDLFTGKPRLPDYLMEGPRAIRAGKPRTGKLIAIDDSETLWLV